MDSKEGLLQRVKELKQQYEIGSYQAHLYLQAEQDYLALRTQVQNEVNHPGKVPTWDDLYRITCSLSSQFYCGPHHGIYKEYHLADEQDRTEYFTRLVLYCKIRESDNITAARAAAKVLRTHILGPKSTQPLRDIIYRVQNKGAGHCTGNDLLCILHGDCDEKIPSLYLRALTERTLNRFDVERNIAFGFVSLVRVPGEAPQKSIEHSLRSLENLYTPAAYEFKKPFPNLAPE